MVKNKIDISVIIVHYNVKKELFECINSIYKSKPKSSIEIIVVDNDEEKTIQKDLAAKFPKVRYIENVNNGWGGGVNKGLNYAKGEYVYLLNPDTILMNNALDEVNNFAQNKNNVGVVASLLFDKNKKVYSLQGTRLLNPINAVFSLSFLDKFFPNNKISKIFWMKGWNKKKVQKVESATLSAALIKKSVLEEAGGFDEKLFLYYEEYDLAKRLKNLGYENYIIPNSKVIHLWEVSAKKTGRTKEFIENSRKYYFRKYYGVITSFLVEIFLRMDKKRVVNLFLILSILMLAGFLRLHKISENVPFIGDQGWFYMSARDAILSGKIPLLGITSSHTWIHQGPLWTYLLIPVFLISNFNPLSGVVLASIFGIGSVLAAFILGRNAISSKFGLVFAFLFAVSPLVVFHSRFAYHTTPIPFFVLLLFYASWRWVNGNVNYFPAILFLMSILYNFELATVIFWPIIVLYFLYGYSKKKKFVTNLKSGKVIVFSILGLLIPMLPILAFDIQNGFTQTVVFAGWFVYKILQFVGIYEKSPIDSSSFSSAYNFLVIKYGQLTLPVGKSFTVILFIIVFLASLYAFIRRGNREILNVVLGITGIGLVTYLFSGVPSEAYLVMLFPGLIFMFAYSVYSLRNIYLIIFATLFFGIISICILNKTNYLTHDSVTIKMKLEASQEAVNLISDNNYTLTYKGLGQEYVSSVMPYEYLVWWILREKNVDSSYMQEILIREYSNRVEVGKVEVLE